ncbi:MAG: hypothetical protein ACJ8EL_12985 [Rhizomicrobium sp.]
MRSNWNGVTAALLFVLAFTPEAPAAAAAEPFAYAVDFVSTTARGKDMNDKGIATGIRYVLPPGCTPFTCLGEQEEVVWFDSRIALLPIPKAFPTVLPVGISATNWVAGSDPDTTSNGVHAVAWKPSRAGYKPIDLGVLPGMTSSWAAGIDDRNRIVGWSTTGGGLPDKTAPFVWTKAAGMMNLLTQGFPNERPLAISDSGTVATPDHWYMLDNPGSVTPLAPPPKGFTGPGTYPASINNIGDQARFLISTVNRDLLYLFRYHHAGTWQQIWDIPASDAAPFGIGSINEADDITATVAGVGLIAYGPNGVAEPLSTKLSPAYGGGRRADPTIVPEADRINDSGQILAQVLIGRSPRLVRLIPTAPCANNCIHVAAIAMTGKVIGDNCTDAFDRVTATINVVDKAGAAVAGAHVIGRFLDDYYLDERVSSTTNQDGKVTFHHEGLACVGAIAFLVDKVKKNGSNLDFTTGELTDYVIPQP